MIENLQYEIVSKISKCKDTVVLSNMLELMNRSIIWLKKYWTWLDNAWLSESELLQHLREELLDASNYINTLIQWWNEKKQ
jgi:hypothetical protein